MEKVESFPHVYKVQVGERIEDYMCDKDGYVWFDETGMLGALHVFTSKEEAYASLKFYVEKVLK